LKKDIELYNSDNFKPNLVVTALLGPSDEIKVYVSKTALPALLDTNVFIKDAKVQILENETVVSELSLTYPEIDTFNEYQPLIRPYYSSDYKLLDGHKYTVRVEALNKTITKEVTFPEKVNLLSIKIPDNFLNLDYIDGNLYTYYFDTTINIIIDDPITTNYYMPDFYANIPYYYLDQNGEPTDSLIFKKTRCFWQFDEVNEVQYVYGTYPYETEDHWLGCSIISDVNFNGLQYNIKLNLQGYVTVREGEDIKLYCKLVTISEDLNRFFVSAEKAENSQGNPFVEPVNLYSNIESDEDYGLITGYNYTIDSIIIQP
jgi:hypothetical protein